jgi:hypothetical protein
VIVFVETLFAFSIILGANTMSQHPKMSRKGIVILLSGTSLLALAGVEMFARRISGGPPDPGGAAHMAIFLYPLTLIAGAVLILVSAMLISCGLSYPR